MKINRRSCAKEQCCISFDSLVHEYIDLLREICAELLEAQQQTISSFVESIEKNISVNSELAQSLLEQASGAASRSLQEQVQGHSLQLVAEEFRKIREPKISKLKGGYLANAMLVFNSWLKDIKMCIQE